MSKYSKPIVTVNDDLAEAVFLASGVVDEGARDLSISASPVMLIGATNDKARFEINVVNASNYAGKRMQLTFILNTPSNIISNDPHMLKVDGDGTMNVTITYDVVMNVAVTFKSCDGNTTPALSVIGAGKYSVSGQAVS